jgi:hypothetical protein
LPPTLRREDVEAVVRRLGCDRLLPWPLSEAADGDLELEVHGDPTSG